MKRRNFLQTIAYSSLAAGVASASPLNASSQNKHQNNSTGKSKRFGDGRNWFFEKRFGYSQF